MLVSYYSLKVQGQDTRSTPEVLRLIQERQLYISESHETSVTLELGPSDFNALVLALQPLNEGLLVILQCEGVQALCHSLLYLIPFLKTAAPELLFQSGDHPEVTGG